MITQALHAIDYDAVASDCADLSPVLCPDGMCRILNAEHYTWVGNLAWRGGLNCVVRYLGELYAVAEDGT